MISKHTRNLLLACLAAATALAPLASHAQSTDRQILDALLKNNRLTQEEYAQIAKGMSAVYCQNDDVVKLALSGKTQMQYEFIDSSLRTGSAPNANATVNSFTLRRVILQADASLKNDWLARVSVDMALKNYLGASFIQKTFRDDIFGGNIRVGYAKPKFALEEVRSSFKLATIERSVATNFFTGTASATKLGFGSYMSGAYWTGKPKKIKGFTYTIEATNNRGYEFKTPYADGDPDVWASLAYDRTLKNKGKLSFNLNFGYGAKAYNSNATLAPQAILGINPYITYEDTDIFAFVEMFAAGIDKGRRLSGGEYERSWPIGLNAVAEYKFDMGQYGKIAPAFRFAFIDTNGHGTLPGDGIRHAKNIPSDTPYNCAQSYYFGANWYIKDAAVKVSLGYEYAQYWGMQSSDKAHLLDCNSVKTQLQLSF